MEQNNQQSYTILKWNGQYGGRAKFVVRDNSSGKQSMFTPGRTQDLVWVRSDLANAPEIQNWEDFENETVSNLEDVAF
jgi:hypothetical protein